MKKNLNKIYKLIVSKIFMIFYGRISLSKIRSNNINITNIFKVDNHNVKKFNYKFYKIKGGRFFTNYVENIAIILKNILIKEVSFQQINSKLQQHKNEALFTGTPKFQ